jgi:group I intron endonuclease
VFIYKITNNINNKIYIGKTSSSLERRFSQHIYSHKKRNTLLCRAMRKYGCENFKIEEIEYLNNSQKLNEREMYWIKNLKPHYNMTIGGDGGDTTAKYNEKEKKRRGKKISNRMKKLWEDMEQKEKTRRGVKSQINTDQVEKGKKISNARKLLFESETPEQKELRVEKARRGYEKVQQPQCSYCGISVNFGNIKRHSEKCHMNPVSPKYGKKKAIIHNYILISPENKKYIIKGKVKKFCKENNLSLYLLKKHIGYKIEKIDERTNNANFKTHNTIGWCLAEIIKIGN